MADEVEYPRKVAYGFPIGSASESRDPRENPMAPDPRPIHLHLTAQPGTTVHVVVAGDGITVTSDAAAPALDSASFDDVLEAAITRLESSGVSANVRDATDGLLATGYTLRLPETNVPGKRPENYLRIMDPTFTAHGIGYLTPSMFSFSRMSDRDFLRSLPGATLTTSAVSFSHVDDAQPGLEAARLLMEVADSPAPNPNVSNPPDSDLVRKLADLGLFTNCQRCGYPFGAQIRQEFCNVRQACDRRLRDPGYRVPKGRAQDLTIRNATIAKHPQLGL
jgi:hypothetical protein